METSAIFNIPPKPEIDEFFETLFKNGNIKIERIVFYGIPTPEGSWYEQKEFEWLTVLEGSATIRYCDGRQKNLKRGDALYIPPLEKHRVERVSNPCVWLTVKGYS